MKKILFLSILILLLSPFAASAHQESKDFFDFESYVGNDETLRVVPDAGTYGTWGINNPVGPSGQRDGVTSETTDKGTSMVLVRKNAQYPGIYYAFKNGYHVTDTLHVSFAIKISGTLEDGAAIFRFRKPNNSTPYNIMTFSDSGNITFYGKIYRKDGITPKYKKDKWYYVDALYDVESGYTKINLTDGKDFNIDYEGMSGYEDALTPVQLVMMETTGYIKKGLEGRIYLDDWLVETVPKMYVENEVQTFSGFRFSDDGTLISDSYMLTGFTSKVSDSKPYAGVFKDSLKESDDALSLCMNTDIPLSLWGEFKNKVKKSGSFETDIRLCSFIADTCIYLGDSHSYEKAIRIEAQNGNVRVFGQPASISLTAFKDYHISLDFDLNSKCALLSVSDGETIRTNSFKIPSLSLDSISAYKLAFENYLPYGQTEMKAVFDNISLKGGNSLYLSYCDKKDAVSLSADNIRTEMLTVPFGFETSYFFSYTVNPDNENGRAKLMLSGEGDECMLCLDMQAASVGTNADDRVSFDKKSSVAMNAHLTADGVSLSAIQNGAVIFEKEIPIDFGKKFKGSYLEYETTASELLEVTEYFAISRYDFDISEAFVSGNGEYTVKFNNPVDSNAPFTVKANKTAAEYELVDESTLKIHFSTETDANITLSGIKDIFGNVKTLNAEVSKTNVNDRFVISNPVFLAEKSGIYTEISEITPGSLTAVVNIKKADE